MEEMAVFLLDFGTIKASNVLQFNEYITLNVMSALLM